MCIAFRLVPQSTSEFPAGAGKMPCQNQFGIIWMMRPEKLNRL
jgi:hypothetical protein